MFQQVTGVTLPRSAKELSRMGDKVALADLRPGDLVFFNTRRFAFSHVGIYLGDNRFIHAPRRGREVEIATIDAGYWQKHFNGARRLIGVLPEMIPLLDGRGNRRAACRPSPRRTTHSRSDEPLARVRRDAHRPSVLARRRAAIARRACVVGALRPIERAGAVLIAPIDVGAARDQQLGRRELRLRAPPSSAPSCRSAIAR